MIKIQDINIPTKGIGKYFLIKVISLDLPNSTPTFYWQVQTEFIDIGEADEQPTAMPGFNVIEGNLTMTESEYALWGTDDNYVVDWALEKLGFTRA
jgi:hypothetical protein